MEQFKAELEKANELNARLQQELAVEKGKRQALEAEKVANQSNSAPLEGQN